MANFQRTPGDKTTRLNKGGATLILMLEERVEIDLWGGGPGGAALAVDTDSVDIVTVTDPIFVNAGASLTTYGIEGVRSGVTRICARDVAANQSYANEAARRMDWMRGNVWASLDVTVFGAEYLQSGGTWGNLKYGSTNPRWAKVNWTNMALAGCGPTSLAIVLDYLDRLSPDAPKGAVSFKAESPEDTMKYTSRYGRAADDAGVPQGTSGKIMMDNISKYWPEYTSRPVLGLEDAKSLLRQHEPIIFLAKHNVMTWKYGRNGTRLEHKWPGHFMVVLGFEGPGDPFWISDPSLFQSKFISADDLSKCDMWVVERWTPPGP